MAPFQLKSYNFELPKNLIAQEPCEPRDAARLLVVDRKSGSLQHRIFRELSEILDARDLLVVNNTRVFKARLLGHRLPVGQKSGTSRQAIAGKVEFLMLEEVKPLIWEGALHASAKHKPGVLFFVPTPDGVGLIGELIRGASQSPHGTVWVQFNRDPIQSGAGIVPLPPYIQRECVKKDEETYQSIYAQETGSAAAPTAGFHFTNCLIKILKQQNIHFEEVTLHVGLGTFRPVKAPDIRMHTMHEERYVISENTAATVTAAKKTGNRIVAVGTTSVRTLESAWAVDGSGTGFLKSGMGRTSLFLHPGHAEFKVIDRLITNFHLPRSTLLMLVCAFAGRDLIFKAYAEAIREKYRFFSYGDAMLIV